MQPTLSSRARCSAERCSQTRDLATEEARPSRIILVEVPALRFATAGTTMSTSLLAAARLPTACPCLTPSLEFVQMIKSFGGRLLGRRE